MRLFLNTHYFISVLNTDKNLNGDIIYNCQIMELVHGFGMVNAKITDAIQSDIVSAIVHNSDIFPITSLKTIKLEEVFSFHKDCLLKLL